MVGKCRYWSAPAVYKKLGRRLTLADRFRRWRNRKEEPDIPMVTGFFPAVWIRK